MVRTLWKMLYFGHNEPAKVECEVLGESMQSPSMGPYANLLKEGDAAQRELMRMKWLPSKPVLLANAGSEL